MTETSACPGGPLAMPFKTLLLIILLAAGTAAAPALAQEPPDAGRTLQELREPPQPQPAGRAPAIEVPPPVATAPGGALVELRQVVFSGNTRLAADQLAALVADQIGKPLDLAGLRALAARVTASYQAHGYPFARAYLPPQPVSDGVVQIAVVEGRYGRILPQGDERLGAAARGWLAALQPGAVIDSPTLERATLLLGDQPGMRSAALIRPGTELGTGDLVVGLAADAPYSGTVSADNYGNRYTGEYRGRLDLNLNSPFTFGDQLQLRGMLTSEDQLFGSLDYSLPVGHDGLRAQAGYAYTDYQLAKEYSALHSTGTAEVASLGLSYPLLRSRQSNLTLAATYRHKWLKDRPSSFESSVARDSDSLPVSLQFDHRDQLLGGGITYGALTWTPGHVAYDERPAEAPAGSFHKVVLDVARVQQLGGGASLYARFSGQKSSCDLDSSEDFGLGGIYGVRAYPNGEGYGDQGFLAQAELRYTTAGLTPYFFYDLGEVRIDKSGEGADNHRRIDGGGIGVRGEYRGCFADVAVAWRTRGGEPESDSRDSDPRVWAQVGYRF